MAKHITLTEKERTELLQLIKSGQHPARVLGRARILLLLDRSQGDNRILAQGITSPNIPDGVDYNFDWNIDWGLLSWLRRPLPCPSAANANRWAVNIFV